MGRVVLAVAFVGIVSFLGACAAEQKAGGCRGCASSGSIVLLNVTSGFEDARSVTMALQLAGHALDDGRQAVLFFNVRGVKVPTADYPADLSLLADLMRRGAEVHVCPACMKAHGVEPGDLIKGAQVTDRQKLFAKIGPNTVVFTY